MKKRIFSVMGFFMALLLMAAGFLYFAGKQENVGSRKAEQLVALNEIEQLAKAGELEKVSEKTEELSKNIRAEAVVSGGIFGQQYVTKNMIFIMGAIYMAFLLVIFGYVYFAILRPFEKMQDFAEKIAEGNFDIPLNYERSNYFGAFTWAFDSMRREITRARTCEREAILNNKTVIATLSHDIKTPIASIRAYAEGLEANLDSSPEKRAKYLRVLMKKCDEVARLTNDLFLHSLSDLGKLKISLEEVEITGFLKHVVEEMAAGQGDLHFRQPEVTALVLADKNRLLQVTENLINNARKYAKSEMDIFFLKSEGNVEIHFRDYGSGIPDEDIPFIFDKFYRGRNCGTEQGAGLGLYIVKYIMEQMKGKVLLHNHGDGLEVVICLPEVMKCS